MFLVVLTMPASVRSRTYVTAGCQSVRPSVCPVDRQQLRLAAGLLLRAIDSCAGTEYQLSIDIFYRRPRSAANVRHKAQQIVVRFQSEVVNE